MPYSCDTFVALGDATEDGAVLFAKNSDRPCGEAMDITCVARTEQQVPCKRQMSHNGTYFADSQPVLHAVILLR